MTHRTIPVAETFAKWRTDPKYVVAYDALEEEYTLAAALIRARKHALTTQEMELAANQ